MKVVKVTKAENKKSRKMQTKDKTISSKVGFKVKTAG